MTREDWEQLRPEPGERDSREIVVQIDPDHDPIFGGCLMVVTEWKPWGAQGYCDGPAPVPPGRTERGLAFNRIPFEALEFVGRAPWVAGLPAEEEEMTK